ncbi:unnamed protein product [Caenorhabditis sp. 36 PRJEB53466]|nr:unnamed protein product [Caenorhabditis sp. 36 PRJEB53466]
MSDTSKSSESRSKHRGSRGNGGGGWNPFRRMISIVTGRQENTSSTSTSHSDGDAVIFRWTAACLNTTCPIFSRNPQFNMIYSPAPSLLMFVVVTLSSENSMTKTLQRLFELTDDDIDDIREMSKKLQELRAQGVFYYFVRFLVDEERTTTVSKELMSKSTDVSGQQVFASIRPSRVVKYLNTLTFSPVTLSRPPLLTTNGYASTGLNAKWIGNTRKAGLHRFACSYHKKKMEPFFEIRTGFRRITMEQFEAIEVPFQTDRCTHFGSLLVLRPHFLGHLPYANRQLTTETLTKMVADIQASPWIQGRLLLPQFSASCTHDLWKNLMRHGVQPDLGQSQKAPPMASLWHWASMTVGSEGISGLQAAKAGGKTTASQKALEQVCHGRISGESLYEKHKMYAARIDSPFTYLVVVQGIPIFTGSYFGNPPPKSAELFVNAPERIRHRRQAANRKRKEKETRKQKLLRKVRKSEEREKEKDRKRAEKEKRNKRRSVSPPTSSTTSVSTTTTTSHEESPKCSPIPEAEEQTENRLEAEGRKDEQKTEKSKSSGWRRLCSGATSNFFDSNVSGRAAAAAQFLIRDEVSSSSTSQPPQQQQQQQAHIESRQWRKVRFVDDKLQQQDHETNYILRRTLVSKLSSSEADSARVGARQRNRSLKKSPAVQDDDPTTHHQHHQHHLQQHQHQHHQITSTHPHPLQVHPFHNTSLQHHLAPPTTSSAAPEPRRAASFDVAAVSAVPKLSPAPFRPGSFDAGRSAFSPVEVPRLLVQSPLSPLQLEPPPAATDNRLLTVPSPSDFRKSPVVDNHRSFSCESPKGAANSTDFLTQLTLSPNLISQLSAAINRPIGIASPLLDDLKMNIGQLPKVEQMDCSTGGSFETMASGSFEIMTSAQSSFDQGTHTISQATAELLAQMPPKSIIQDDIRAGNGRFALVRKRGRSEVWNLFGQVMDNVTQVRLPYVACYACKVLYTDTGGGTGNMTRHRCPIGASYRSSTHASSTETVEPGGGSFDSTPSARAAGEALSRSALSINMAEGVGGASSGGSASGSGGSASLPLLTQHSGEMFQNTIGDVDREVLTDAIVKCCALDLIDPIVFSGKGFRGLLKQLSHVSKRVSEAPVEGFPDIQTVRNAMQTHLRFCQDDLKNELSRTTQGCRLAIETMTYSGRDYRVIHGSRISPDWKWRSNILGVFKGKETESLKEMVNLVIHNYELNKSLLRITVPNKTNDLDESVKYFLDIKAKLKDILFTILSACTLEVTKMLEGIDRLTKVLVEMDVRLPFATEPREDIFDVHHLLAEWNDQWGQMEQIIASKTPNLLDDFKKMNPQHMRDLEMFILPFRETIESLTSEHPNFHKVLPEWLALQHECQVQNDEPNVLLRELKEIATRVLLAEKDNILSDEHRIAAILNPRLLRKLGMILTEAEKITACEKIRSICNFRNPKQPLSRGSSCDGEPHRKRRMFLSSLEDDQAVDELECYLRSQYGPHQTKDVITFWSVTGHTQFPTLSALARRTLCTPAIAPKTHFDARCASVSPDQLHTFLMLRSMFDSEKDEETA